MTALGSQTVQVHGRTRAKLGKWIDGPAQTWEGLSIQPIGSDERLNLGLTESAWRIFAPAGFPLSADLVIRWRDKELQADGDLQEWMDEETGVVDHVEGMLKEWKG